MPKPAILQTIEAATGRTLTPVDDIRELMKFRSKNTYAGDENGNIIGLNLCNNRLTDQQITFLPDPALLRLKALNLSENQLTKVLLPNEMTGLKYLNLSENKTLQEVIFPEKMPELEELYLEECAIEKIRLNPGLERLKKLDLRKNQLKTISIEGNFADLISLDLSQNQLETLSLPGEFGKLTFLYLNDNSIRKLQLPSKLKALKTLHLRNNQLEELPGNLLEMKQLETLYLHNNPLPGIPKAVIPESERDNAFEKIRDYLREFQKGTLVNDRVKIIIVGNGRVGKTSMFRRLKGEPFNEQEPFTHGVQLGILDENNLPEIKTETLQGNVWDFGGQEIFYATHQFFLTEDALYILAWTDKKNVLPYRQKEKNILPFDEKWQSSEYWLENIRLHGKNSPILMVQTHTDGIETFINQVEFKKEPYLAECLDFSAAKDYGLTKLKDKITQKINDAIPMFGEEFPETYQNVIDEMETLREEKPWITLDKFFEVCRQAKITEGGENSVLDYLRKTGVIVYFGNVSLLKEVVYIDPNWLTRQVYRLINNDLREKKGRLDGDYLNEILTDYNQNDRERFLELLKSFELVFQEEEDGQRVFVAPQYLPDELEGEAKIFFEGIFEELGLRFVFRFPKFMPDNVMVNFLSRYGPFSRKSYWKNGIYFTNQEKAKCVVKYQENDRSLSVYSHDHEKSNNLMREVCQAFVELSKKANAEISLDGRLFVSWQALENAQKLENTKMMTVDGHTPVAVNDFDLFFEKQSKINRPKKIFFSYSKHDRDMLEEFKKHLSSLQLRNVIQPWDDHDIRPGEEWDEKVKEALVSADIILLLVSADFMATKYIQEVEIKEAIRRYEEGGTIIIPVILRATDWEDMPFGKLNYLPVKGKTITSFEDRDEAWLTVVNGIKKVLTEPAKD